jgi:hypothetical protein
MLNDIVQINNFGVGSILYDSGRSPDYTDTTVITGRFYSSLVHPLKQWGGQSLTDLPKTHKQARLRLMQIDKFVTDLDSGQIDPRQFTGKLHYEVQVGIPDNLS